MLSLCGFAAQQAYSARGAAGIPGILRVLGHYLPDTQ
jgi:hypothetical protein